MNFDSSLSFQEFVAGCEFCGISLTLEDFKRVYSMIDYDGEGEVDFKKFCLINTDKSSDVKRLIEQMKKRLEETKNAA